MNKLFGLLLFLSLTIGSLWAQSNSPVRLEFPSSKYTTDLACVLCQQNGLCMVYPSWIVDSAYTNIQHYDTNLNLLNEIHLPVSSNYVCVETAYDQETVYVLYQSKTKKKKENVGMLLLYNLGSHLYDTISIKQLPLTDISRLTAKDGNLFFTAPTNKDNSNIYYIPKGDKFAHGLLIKDAPAYSIEDFILDTISRKAVVCLNTNGSTKDNVIWMCETTFEGEIIHYIDLPDTLDYRFQNARIIQTDTDAYLITGTYQQRRSGLGNTATGIYSIIYGNGDFSVPNLYPYNPIEAQSNRRRSIDNDFDELLYLVGKIYADSGRYALVTEGFYPEYRYSTTYSYGVPTTEPVFVGYRFICGELILFDKYGNKIWDYRFPFNMLMTNLTTHLRVAYPNNNILFYYMSGKDIVTMLIDKDFTVMDPIRPNSVLPTEGANSQSVTTTGLSRWYDNFYILSGYRFKNTGKSKSPTFFLNKLKYQ